jgi:hypothetical protein
LLYDLELEDELAIYIWYSFIFAIFLTLDVIAMLLYFRKQNMVVSVCIIFEILPLELMITYYSTNPAVMKFNWFMFTNIVWTLYTGIILVLKPLLMLQHFFRLLCGACEKFISQRRGQFFVFFPNIRPRIKFLFKTMVFTAMVFPIPILYYRQMSICAPYRRQIFHFWAKNHGFFDDMVFAPDRENYDFSKFSFRKDCRKDLIIEEKVEESTVKYHVADCMVGDLDIILQAKKNVEHKFEAENYNVFTKNSIDYSDAVYEEYRRLEKEKSEKKTDK